jgi:outer membrane receptor for ferrienterochelin and colicins
MKLIRTYLVGTVLSSTCAVAQVNLDDSDSVVELEPYVVTGTRTMQHISQSPVRTELLTSTDLEFTATKTFADAIELVPGIRVENNCQNCGTSEILMLGLEGKYSSLLFDGQPLYSGLASVYGLDQIPSIFIDRIEVVKGAGSSMYGSGAVGGVVNIISHDPIKSGGLAEIRYDDVKGGRSTEFSGMIDYVDAKTAITVYAQTSDTDPVDLNDDGYSELTKRSLDVMGTKVVFNTDKGTFAFNYSKIIESRRGGDQFSLPDNLSNISEHLETKRDTGSISWQSALSERLDYKIDAGFAYTDRDSFYGGLFGHAVDEALVPESSLGAGDNDQGMIDLGYRTYGEVAQDEFGYTKDWVYNVEAQVNYRWITHYTSLGVQYSTEKIEDIVPVSSFVEGYPAEASVSHGDTVGVYVQDDWHFAEGWEFVPGVRFDKNSELDDPIVSPRISLRWQATPSLVLRGTLGTGFRAPQPFDEDLHIEVISGERAKTIQADDLEEEKSVSGLISAVWNPEFAKGRLTVEANAFYTKLDGAFALSEIRHDSSYPEAYRIRYNGPDAEVGGMEFNLGCLPLKNLRIDLGYIIQYARYTEDIDIYDDGEGNVISEDDFLEKPQQYGILQATYTNKDFVDVNFSAIYTGPMKVLNEGGGYLNDHTDRFLVLNLTFSREFKINGFPSVKLSIGVKNIIDDRQEDLEVGYDRDPSYFYGPRTPRTYFVSSRFNF